MSANAGVVLICYRRWRCICKHGGMELPVTPTFRAIEWHLFLNTPKRASVEVIVRRFAKLLGVEVETVSIEVYWKDGSLSDVRLRSPVEANTHEEAVWVLSRSVQRVADGYQTSGPHVSEGRLMEMSVLSASGFADVGITWLEASIRNF